MGHQIEMGSFDSIDYLPEKPFGLALLQRILLNVLIQFPLFASSITTKISAVVSSTSYNFMTLGWLINFRMSIYRLT